MTTLKLTTLAMAAVLGAMACSGDSVQVTTAPSQPLDVSALLTASATGDPANYPSAYVGGPSAALGVPSNCAYSASNQRFDCAPVSVVGLTFKTSYYLLGTDGASLSTADASKVASLRVITDVTGTMPVSSPGISSSLTVSKHEDMTLSGLLTGTRTLNGSSTDHDVLTTTGTAASTTTFDANGTTVNLVLPSGTSKYPASGTITSNIKTSTAVAPLPAVSVTTTAVLTFNGTNIATLVTTVSGHVQTCRIDLSGATAPACS